MTDQEIIDALVEAGAIVGSAMGTAHLPDGTMLGGSASMVINDWRTAGACLERISGDLEAFVALNKLDFLRDDDTLPRAICEAFVTAQGEQSTAREDQ